MNNAAIEKIGDADIVGKSIQTVWEQNPAFNFQPVYKLLKENVDQKKPFELQSNSPVNKKRIEIVGHPLTDCYYFSVYELPDKESLILELKSILRRR